MNKSCFFNMGWTLVFLISIALVANGQMNKETITGTVVNYGSGAYTGLHTADFTLTINRQTPDENAKLFLDTLQNGGQDSLMSAIKNEDLGSFSLNNGLARTINVVREKGSGDERKFLLSARRSVRLLDSKHRGQKL
jgi:hypothetical protein